MNRVILTQDLVNQLALALRANCTLAANFAEFVTKRDVYERRVDLFNCCASFRTAELDDSTVKNWNQQRSFFTRKAFGAIITLDGIYAKAKGIDRVFKEYIPYKTAQFDKLSVKDQALALDKMYAITAIAEAVADGLDYKDLCDLGLAA